MAIDPFEYVNAINQSKQNLIVDEETEKDYNPFLTNKSLSYFPDTIYYANVMNGHHEISKKLQFSYLLNIVKPKKRFSKWVKPEKDDDLKLIMKHYGYNVTKAKVALSILTPDQIKIIEKQQETGGVKK